MAILKIYSPIVHEEARAEMLMFCGIDGTSFNSIDAFVASVPETDDTIDVRLHCPGGNIMEGWAIVDRLRATGKKIIATIEGNCASIATIVLLAASERKGAKHAKLLIHDPYFPEYTLADAYHAEDLERMAESLRNDKKNILDFYVERTGADRAVLEALMKQEKFIGMERAKELGFIHEIIEPSSAKADSGSASENWKKSINNQKSKTMSNKNKNAIAKAFAALSDALGLGAPQAVNYELNTASGETITIDKPEGEDPAVGDPASPDGEHTMPDGQVIVIADGVIIEIRDAEGDEGAEALATANARIAELETECESLRKNAKSAADKRILNLVTIAGGEAWLTKARSEYKPQGRATTGGAPAGRSQAQTRPSRVQQQLEALKKKNGTTE